MKKKYIIPSLAVKDIETENIIALSLKEGAASSSYNVLVKGNNGNEWDIWGEDDFEEE